MEYNVLENYIMIMDLLKYYPTTKYLVQEESFTSYKFCDNIYDKYSDVEVMNEFSRIKSINWKIHGTYNNNTSSRTYNRGELIKYESKNARYYRGETSMILEIDGYNQNEEVRTFIFKIKDRKIVDFEEISHDYHVPIPCELKYLLHSHIN